MSYSVLNNLPLRTNDNSYWFADKKNIYRNYLHCELAIRKLIDKYCRTDHSVVCTSVNVEILKVRYVVSAKVNLFICKHAKRFDKDVFITNVSKILNKHKYGINIGEISVNVTFVDKYIMQSYYVAKLVSNEMQRRITVRKLSRIAHQVMQGGAKGCIIEIKGRINGYEISRHDRVLQGTIGRHTLSNNISFSRYVHLSTKGCVGIKVWVNRGKLTA